MMQPLLADSYLLLGDESRDFTLLAFKLVAAKVKTKRGIIIVLFTDLPEAKIKEFQSTYLCLLDIR